MAKYSYFFFSSLMIILLTGCGLTTQQIIQTQSFGNATSHIGSISENEFVNIRASIIEMNEMLVTIDNTKSAKNIQFDFPTSPEATATRVAAAKALNHYGELLTKLASDKSSENLQDTADSFIANMNTALKKNISDDKEDALANLLSDFGTFFINKKKADALKSIIPTYRKPVNTLADLLQKDFSLDSGSTGFLKAYDITAKRLKNASIRLIDAGKEYSILERKQAVKAVAMSTNASQRARSISIQIKQAINNLKNANDEIVKVINNNTYSSADIKAYAMQIHQLVNIYKVLSN